MRSVAEQVIIRTFTWFEIMIDTMWLNPDLTLSRPGYYPYTIRITSLYHHIVICSWLYQYPPPPAYEFIVCVLYWPSCSPHPAHVLIIVFTLPYRAIFCIGCLGWFGREVMEKAHALNIVVAVFARDWQPVAASHWRQRGGLERGLHVHAQQKGQETLPCLLWYLFSSVLRRNITTHSHICGSSVL